MTRKRREGKIERGTETHLVDAADDSINDLAPKRPVHDRPVPNRKHRLTILHDPPSMVTRLARVLLNDSDDVPQPSRAGTLDLAAELGGEVA